MRGPTSCNTFEACPNEPTYRRTRATRQPAPPPISRSVITSRNNFCMTTVKRIFCLLLACLGLVFQSVAKANDTTALISLASTPPEQFHQQLSNYLSTHTNRFDVAAAASNGWQACLTAMIINSRLDHPTEYQAVDTPTPSGNETMETSYKVLSISNVFDEAS